jgi:exodeoxyribonuclease VII small subunit
MERISFEEALQKLEAIVNKLEDGAVPLEESVSLFEEGMKLSKHCSEILEKAELRIEKVNQDQTS